jgi:hypothetical protein
MKGAVMHPRIITAACTVVAFGLGHPALGQPTTAQDEVVACPSQQELEQVLASNGTIASDDCWTININSLVSNGERLCLLDFSASGGSILSRLQSAAMPTQWWVRCDALTQAAAER